MFVYLFHLLNELDSVTTSGSAVGAKASPGIGLGVDLQRRLFVVMPGTAQAVPAVGLEVVVSEYRFDGEARLDLGNFHVSVKISIERKKITCNYQIQIYPFINFHKVIL